MIRIISLIGGLLCGFAALPATGEIYQFTDSYGTINFTDNKDKIPAKYPVKEFVFNNEHKWTIDQSDTKTQNQARLDALRAFNAPVPRTEATPQATIVTENQCSLNKRHRSQRVR